MTAALLLIIAGFHLLLAACGLIGPSARTSAGLLAVCCNYGLRRLLFLSPELGGDQTLWFAIILLGDATLMVLTIMSFLRPTSTLQWTAADGAVLALALYTVALAGLDGRLPLAIRAAHWKEEYLYLLAYLLVRLNGTTALQALGGLHGLAGLTVLIAFRQAIFGPLDIDLAWIASGRSVLTAGDIEEIVGAHTLGDLDAGWLRPFGLFGNGTDMGVFLAFLLCHTSARVSGRIKGTSLAAMAVQGFGIVLTVVRFTWATAIGGLLVQVFLLASWHRRLFVMGSSIGVMVLVLAVSAIPSDETTSDNATLWQRAFVVGTLEGRWHDQNAYLATLSETPTILVWGEGFGLSGSAVQKLGDEDMAPSLTPHSRLLDWVRDGGLPLLILATLPLILALKKGAQNDRERAASLGFAVSLFVVAALLGGKSATLATLFWASLGAAQTRERR